MFVLLTVNRSQVAADSSNYLEGMATQHIKDPNDLATFMEFARGGLSRVQQSWIENGCRQDPAELGRTLARLIEQGLSAFPNES